MVFINPPTTNHSFKLRLATTSDHFDHALALAPQIISAESSLKSYLQNDIGSHLPLVQSTVQAKSFQFIRKYSEMILRYFKRLMS